MERYLMEELTKKQVAAPADLNAAAVAGARIKIEKGFRLAIELNFGASVAAAVAIDIDQHDAATGGNSKALEISNPYFYKADADAAFTRVEVATATDSYDLASVFAADKGIVVFEVLAEDLDVNNDFNYVSVNVADSTAAKIMAGTYVLRAMKVEPAYKVEV